MFDMQKRSETIAFRCDRDVLEELARRAEAEDRSVSSVARRALALGLRRRETDEREESPR